jgi:hypothetical protein
MFCSRKGRIIKQGTQELQDAFRSFQRKNVWHIFQTKNNGECILHILILPSFPLCKRVWNAVENYGISKWESGKATDQYSHCRNTRRTRGIRDETENRRTVIPLQFRVFLIASGCSHWVPCNTQSDRNLPNKSELRQCPQPLLGKYHVSFQSNLQFISSIFYNKYTSY